MPSPTPRVHSIVWFRRDLRLDDNPALASAAARGAVLPLYVLDDETPGEWRAGGAQRWWLHHSLAALDRELRARGSRLVLRRGPAATVVAELAGETGAAAVHWNRCYEGFAVARDAGLKSALAERGIRAESFNASLLAEPWQVATAKGMPYTVFTPFWRALRAQFRPTAPVSAPRRLDAPGGWPGSDTLGEWRLLPNAPDWAEGLRATWTPGEGGARDRLCRFVDGALASYATSRDRPDLDGVSMLSAHLAFGEIGPRQVWRAVAAAGDGDPARAGGAEAYLRELAWREFSYHLLFHRPELSAYPLRGEFQSFPWRDDAQALAAWRRGRTGYPLVDAGMRQLWRTGWMHNRVRMIVASFLVKHLMLPWQAGAAWFWDTLVDADLANNSASWQWVAGCGADAAPFFRVFNPVLQGRKFDPQGAYVRRYVPELARLPDAHIHEPWAAPPAIRARAEDYPPPIVEHGAARARALAAWRALAKPGA